MPCILPVSYTHLDVYKRQYYNIGARRPGEQAAYPIHSDRFNPDEECIRVGILTEVLAVLKILEEENS